MTTWVISSVGLERCFDRAEVTGSSPVLPTRKGVSFVACGPKRVGFKLRLKRVSVGVIGALHLRWEENSELGFQD